MNGRVTDVSVSLEELSPILTTCLQAGQEAILTISGNSMNPLLRHRRDQVVLAAVDGEMLRPGDVPLYCRRNGAYVLHRVVVRDDGRECVYLDGTAQPSTATGDAVRYTMLGDAQTDLEHGIAPSQIVACAVAFIRHGKRIECTSKGYRRYVRWWHWWLFARRYLLWIYWLPSRVARKGRSYVGQ